MNSPTDETRPSEAFREKVFARTLPALNRRVRRKRLLMLCALSAAYVIGLFSAAWYLAPEATAPPVQSASAQKPLPLPGDDLHEAERAALMAARESPEQRREALREAGNRWLDVQGDIARATQLYGRFLDTMPADELGRFDPNDTWLLRALRCARLQENAHENADT